MKVILCNDDIGLTFGFTEAIKDTFLKGTSSNTSIRTNGPAYDFSVKLLKTSLKGIGLGLHLNLVDGKAHTTVMANRSGNYKYNFLQLLILSQNKTVLKNIEKELDFQFQKVTKDGLRIDHVSCHRHTYIIPAIFEIICKLCKKYQIRSIRLIQEPFYLTNSFKKNISPFITSNFLKFLISNYFAKQNRSLLKKYRLTSTDAFYGVLYTDAMNLQTIQAALEDAKKRHFKSIEILIHPAYPKDHRDKIYTSQVVREYVRQKSRLIETKVSLSKGLKQLFSSTDFKLSTYKNI